MADGKTHDAVGLALTPLAIVAAVAAANHFQNPRLIWVGAIAYIFGITHLSPDIDLKSNPWRRWWLLRWIWWGYQEACPHRGFSHNIMIGTLSRVVYLALPILMVLLVSGQQEAVLGNAITLTLIYWQEILTALVALEVSAWVHLILDGIFLKRIGRIFGIK
jgi:uncharacterized metal-binding protein